MAKRKPKNVAARKTKETDERFFLKIVTFLILGSIWARIVFPSGAQLPIPIGLCLGVIFARHEHFQIDRKIEYVVLLIASFIAFWLPVGMYIYI